MHDRYNSFSTGLESPVIDGFTITPNNDEDLPEMTRAIYIGGSGTLAVTIASGSTVTLAGVTSGTILPLRARRVLSAGTTATEIVGFV